MIPLLILSTFWKIMAVIGCLILLLIVIALIGDLLELVLSIIASLLDFWSDDL